MKRSILLSAFAAFFAACQPPAPAASEAAAKVNSTPDIKPLGWYQVAVEQDGKIIPPDKNRIVKLKRKPFTLVFTCPAPTPLAQIEFHTQANEYDYIMANQKNLGKDETKNAAVFTFPGQGAAEDPPPNPEIFIHAKKWGEGVHYWDSDRFNNITRKDGHCIARRKVGRFSLTGDGKPTPDKPFTEYKKNRVYVIPYANAQSKQWFNVDGARWEMPANPPLIDQCFIIEFPNPS